MDTIFDRLKLKYPIIGKAYEEDHNTRKIREEKAKNDSIRNALGIFKDHSFQLKKERDFDVFNIKYKKVMKQLVNDLKYKAIYKDRYDWVLNELHYNFENWEEKKDDFYYKCFGSIDHKLDIRRKSIICDYGFPIYIFLKYYRFQIKDNDDRDKINKFYCDLEHMTKNSKIFEDCDCKLTFYNFSSLKTRLNYYYINGNEYIGHNDLLDFLERNFSNMNEFEIYSNSYYYLNRIKKSIKYCSFLEIKSQHIKNYFSNDSNRRIIFDPIEIEKFERNIKYRQEENKHFKRKINNIENIFYKRNIKRKK